MFYKIIGIFFTFITIYVSYFVIKNKSNMPINIFVNVGRKYEIVNKDKFNNMMIIQAITIIFWFIVIGSSLIIFKNQFIVTLACITPIINIIFSMIARKYIEFR